MGWDETYRPCKACKEPVRYHGHYVSSVGHYAHPSEAIEPYYTCTGETAVQVARRDSPWGTETI